MAQSLAELAAAKKKADDAKAAAGGAAVSGLAKAAPAGKTYTLVGGGKENTGVKTKTAAELAVEKENAEAVARLKSKGK